VWKTLVGVVGNGVKVFENGVEKLVAIAVDATGDEGLGGNEENGDVRKPWEWQSTTSRC
jgi:hypothetical protein